MRVLKFGGSSVANATNISKVLDIVEAEAATESVVLVCSAIKGCTDKLIAIGKMAENQDPSGVKEQQSAAVTARQERDKSLAELLQQHLDIINRLFTGVQKTEAEEEIRAIFDEIASLRPVAVPGSNTTSSATSGNTTTTTVIPIESYGEILSTKIIARKLACEGYETKWLDSRNLIVRGNEPLTISNIAAATAQQQASVAPQQQAAATAQQQASVAPQQPTTPALPTRIFVAPGFIARDDKGAICTLGRGGSDYSAALYAAGCKASRLEIWTDVPGMMTTNPKVVSAARTIPNISYKAALELAENGAKVLYAPTVVPAMNAGIAFSILNTFDPTNPGTLVSNLPEPESGVWRGVTSAPNGNTVRMALVGEGPVGEESSRRRVLACLKESGIRVLGIEAKDEGRIIFADVLASQEKAATIAIHREFFEVRRADEVRLLIAGHGAVAKAMVTILAENGERIARRTNKSIRIIGISNSSRYCIDPKGIAPEDVEARLENGISAEGGAFFKAICESVPRGAVLADCTGSLVTCNEYEGLFEKGISVVTSNRRSLSVPYSQYVSMKTTALENGVAFKYGTTVGNALPILESLSSGANNCDKVTSIEAVVSCTLNHIITSYDGNRSDNFATILRRAQEAGLTEKDPRADLEGRDALRKLLILSREAGIPLESEDVNIIPMVGPEFFEGSVEDFYRKLSDHEPQFVQMEQELDIKGVRQRFVASVWKDPESPIGYSASIGMKLVGVDSPFYWISGTENVTVIKSENITHPLVIKGSGEGAKLAASGVINDILTV